MRILNKRYQVVWNAETKEIIKKGGNETHTRQACFESDNLAEVEAKIEEEGLTEVEVEGAGAEI